MTVKRDLVQTLKEMVRLNTTNPPGNERIVVDYLADIFRREGVPFRIVEPERGRANIVAWVGPTDGTAPAGRDADDAASDDAASDDAASDDAVATDAGRGATAGAHGADGAAKAGPVVLISHLDVVPADASEWTDDPFAAVERDGVIYGRGTLDTKYLTAMELGAFLAVKDAPLSRPVYFVATADEEQGSTLGMPHVVERWRDAFTDGVVINEGGGFFIEDDGRPFYLCTVGEKGRCRVRVTINGDAGPASFPCDNKATDTFLTVLDRLAAEQFPREDNPVAARFDALVGDLGESDDGARSEDVETPGVPASGVSAERRFLRAFREYNSRDTFILKRYDVGTAVNALPYEIAFDLELQLLPSRDRAYAEAVFRRVFDRLNVRWEITEFRPGFASRIDGPAYASLAHSAAHHFGGAQLLPVYALGQTDGRFLGGLPADVYGFAPVTPEIPFTEVLTLVHQKNEKITRRSVEDGARIIERCIRDVAVHDGEVPPQPRK